MSDTKEVEALPKKTVEVLTGPQLLIKATLYSLKLTTVMLLVTFIAIALYWIVKTNAFFETAQISHSELKTVIQTGLKTEPKKTNGSTTILILGLDSLETRPGSPQLTDTIMLASLNYQTATITTLPLPRDIWSQDYQTKINALYHYGKERYPETPEQFPTEVISEMTGIPIEYTIVITLDQIAEVIDTLGGVEVDIPTAFTDETFPRPDVDVTKVSDPKLLYKTISFETGLQVLSSTQTLEYIRSRKSGDGQGDDLARSQRQQIIIESLVNKVTKKETFTDFALLGNLYKYYQETFEKSVPLTECIGLASQLFPKRAELNIQTAALPIAPGSPNGVLVNPPVSKYSVWVYEVSDTDTFRKYVQSLLE